MRKHTKKKYFIEFEQSSKSATFQYNFRIYDRLMIDINGTNAFKI